jgi:hypothetical protein
MGDLRRRLGYRTNEHHPGQHATGDNPGKRLWTGNVPLRAAVRGQG